MRVRRDLHKKFRASGVEAGEDQAVVTEGISLWRHWKRAVLAGR